MKRFGLAALLVVAVGQAIGANWQQVGDYDMWYDKDFVKQNKAGAYTTWVKMNIAGGNASCRSALYVFYAACDDTKAALLDSVCYSGPNLQGTKTPIADELVSTAPGSSFALLQETLCKKWYKVW